MTVGDFTLEHPDLDTDDAVRRCCFRRCIIDVGTQRMKRHATFAIPFTTGDFRTIQTTRAHDLDALGTKAHGVLHRALHGTTEHDALFELLGDRVGNQLRIKFRLADLFDADMNRHAHDLLQCRAQRVDLFALFADNDTRASRKNGHAGVLGRTLDQHTANGSMLQFFLEVITNL